MTTSRIKWIALFLLLSLVYKAQHVCAKIDGIGLVIPGLKVIRPSVEVSFLRHFSGALTYENGKYKSGTKQINNNNPYEVYKLTGWGLIPEFRLYPRANVKPAPTGIFIGAFFKYRQVEEVYTGNDFLLSTNSKAVSADIRGRGLSYAYGIDLGYKVSLSYFTLEFLIGAGPAKGKWKEPNQRDRIDPFYSTDLDHPENSFRAEISLGLMVPKIRNEKTIKDPPSAESDQDGLSTVARVVMYRPKRLSGFAVDYDLYANDSLIATINNGAYVTATFPPGEVKFKARTESSQTLILHLEKGRTYYLECGLQGGMFVGQPSLRVVKPEEGQAVSAPLLQNRK